MLPNHKKLDFPPLCFCSRIRYRDYPPVLPPTPLHLYLTLYLDHDRDCHLGRLQGADCSVAEANIAHSPKHSCSLLTAEEGELSTLSRRNKGVCPLFVTRSVKHQPQIPLSSLHKQDKTAVRAVLTYELGDYKRSRALARCPDDLLIKSLYSSLQRHRATPPCESASKFCHKRL